MVNFFLTIISFDYFSCKPFDYLSFLGWYVSPICMYVQEALKIYTRELPAMNYAANTGKQSMFLEKCVSNGYGITIML